MKGQDLKSQFTNEFFEEFQYDSEFISIFNAIENGLTPYGAIEHLCKSKKELFNALKRAIENAPIKIIVTPERFEEIKTEAIEDVNVLHCDHPKDKRRNYHDASIVCDKCKCVIEQFGKKIDPPSKLG